MRLTISSACVAMAILAVFPTQGFAASSYLCAISEVQECLALTGCKRVAPKDLNMSSLVALDIDKNELSSAALGEPSRSEDIEGVVATDKAIYLYGTQDAATWNATISLENGALAGGITSGSSSFALFGNCTKK